MWECCKMVSESVCRRSFTRLLVEEVEIEIRVLRSFRLVRLFLSLRIRSSNVLIWFEVVVVLRYKYLFFFYVLCSRSRFLRFFFLKVFFLEVYFLGEFFVFIFFLEESRNVFVYFLVRVWIFGV